MLERDVEKHFRKTVEEMGGKSYKFTSPSHRGASYKAEHPAKITLLKKC